MKNIKYKKSIYISLIIFVSIIIDSSYSFAEETKRLQTLSEYTKSGVLEGTFKFIASYISGPIGKIITFTSAAGVALAGLFGNVSIRVVGIVMACAITLANLESLVKTIFGS